MNHTFRRSLFGFTRSFIVAAILSSLPVFAFARGGGGGSGGGGGHGGGGHFGGGGFGGARGFHGAGPGFHGYGPGFHGSGPGFRGYGVAYPGFVGGYRGYGWGYPGYYGWGYPYYGTGLGLGLGLGLGYGLSSGYGYGYGYPSYAYPYSYGSGGYGTGGYGTGSYGASGYGSTVTSTNTPEGGGTTYSGSTTSTTGPVLPASASATSSSISTRSNEFAERGKSAFKSGRYDQAVYALRHAVVDDPQNLEMVLLLGQAFFAIGKYEESVGAVQAAMQQLPKQDWGKVVEHYREFYGDAKDYSRQLRALEQAIGHKPENPALRFLAGYHFGFLGFLKPSIEQLDKAIQIESRDEVAKLLRSEMESRLAKPEPLMSEPGVPPTPATTTWTRSR